jgi:hypothetical protein
MFCRLMIVLTCMLVFPFALWADDRLVRLHAPEALVETGLLKHILPRFSLKTQVRVELVSAGNAQLVLGDGGRPLFEGAGQVWKMDVPGAGHAGTDKLAAWLTSDIGARTIQGYAPDGEALFGPPEIEETVVAVLDYDGDAVLGHEVAVVKCARCHAVDDRTRWSSIGSTPSFAVLRTFEDWEGRFFAFYVLKPHAAFTQITDVTQPFPENRPSPIAPIELTLDEVDALVAYVAGIQAADLGKPLAHQ